MDIAITSAISPGFYDLYTKTGGTIPKAISPTLHNVVEVLADFLRKKLSHHESCIHSYESLMHSILDEFGLIMYVQLSHNFGPVSLNRLQANMKHLADFATGVTLSD